jgi:1,4-dihydroxy-2-naphthoate octaprenyltransferase
LFFGIVGVCGTFFLHTRLLFLLPYILLPAVAFGLLSTGVLNVNNMRDIVNDAASGKRTLVVRMGSAKAKIYHTALVVVGILCLVLFTVQGRMSWSWWLFLLVVPGFVVHLKRVWTTKEPRDLDPQLKVLAMGTFFTALLFSLGLILA